ncbi:ABC transporter ATP-binding protein [Kitasatospora sp. NPDC005856]|uniref:ABC transporter ATP-binding protein n=1 Tax=Kitasatospora sp. NPDC005856 TaxID=3154566 RepID=UPI0034043E3D
MSPVLEAEGLGMRYGRHHALTDVNLSIPEGRVIGLVGPNGAGKSTLMGLTSGLLQPTSGTIRVLGTRPGTSASQLAKVGFVAQDTPVYAGLTVADHLRLGARLNPRWDAAMAERRIKQIGLDLTHKAGRLSGGQRAQLALTIAAAKRPELVIFDEPVAALDPLARRGFMQNLMELVAELGSSVMLSSHLLGDLERVCDYLVLVVASRVQLAGDVDDLLAGHCRLTGARGAELPPGVEVVQAEQSSRQSNLIVRMTGPLASLNWTAETLGLEDLVLAYMNRAEFGTGQYDAAENTGVQL